MRNSFLKMESPPPYKKPTEEEPSSGPPSYKSPSETQEEKSPHGSPTTYKPSSRADEEEERKSTFVYKKRSTGTGQQWIFVMVVVVGAILIISGLTLYIFISVFQEEPVEKRSVLFPFEKESFVSFTSVSNINSQIRNAVHREEVVGTTFEITFQEHRRPLFVNDMLKGTEADLPEAVKSNLEGFSIGVHDGNVFVLMSFKRDAYPLLLDHSEAIFHSLEHFIGRASTRELERLKRANTLLVLRNGGVVYGFLNDHTIAVTDTEELFLEILDLYRESFN